VNLLKDFDKRAFVVFKAEEISEPLIMIYRYLSLMVHLESDMLTVSPTELRFMTLVVKSGSHHCHMRISKSI
jgi:hypothetical protein